MKQLLYLTLFCLFFHADLSWADNQYVRMNIPYGDSLVAETHMYLEVFNGKWIQRPLAELASEKSLPEEKVVAFRTFSDLSTAALEGSPERLVPFLDAFGEFETDKAKVIYPKLLVNVANNFDPKNLTVGFIADLSENLFMANMYNPTSGYGGTAMFRRSTLGSPYKKVFSTYDAVASCINYEISTEDIINELPPELSELSFFDKSMGQPVSVFSKYVSAPDIASHYPDVVELIEIYKKVRDEQSFQLFCSRMDQGGDWACADGFEAYKASNLYRHEDVVCTGMLDLQAMLVIFYSRSGGVEDAFYLRKKPSGFTFVNQNTHFAHDSLFKNHLWMNATKH